VLARKADENRREEPEIEFVSPTGNDAPRKLLRDHCIGVEGQVPAMLLHRAQAGIGSRFHAATRALPET
jgi:hypothetical protein